MNTQAGFMAFVALVFFKMSRRTGCQNRSQRFRPSGFTFDTIHPHSQKSPAGLVLARAEAMLGGPCAAVLRRRAGGDGRGNPSLTKESRPRSLINPFEALSTI